MKKYRFMVLIHSMMDIPSDIDTSKNCYIEYTIFDQKVKIKLDLNTSYHQGKGLVIHINKIRVFYLFAPNRKIITDFINEQKVD